jgi:N-acetylglucosamine kinase-like BadF-type ATPase
MSVFVGLDCGGSSTRVLAIDESGKPIFRAQAGPANLLSTPESQLRTNLRAATRGCPKAVSVLGCFAGLVDEAVKIQAIGYLKQLFPTAKKIDAQADYVAALAACGKDADACVIAGTGSIVCSWSDGKVLKSGGRGPILGDVGSAANIGKALLNAYLEDALKASTTLKKAVTEIFGSLDEREIIRRLYGETSPAALLAKLGKTAANESRGGSERARSIIVNEMTGLCHIVARHLQETQFSDRTIRIGLAGGLWKSSPLYRVEFESCLNQEIPEMKIELFVLKRAPVEGAAFLAREAALGN